MSDTAHRVDICRLCGSRRLKQLISLAPMPLGDKFAKKSIEALALEFHHVDMVGCLDCFQVQLSEVIEPSEVYDDYLYTTSVSVGLPEHFKQSADELSKTMNLNDNSFVVEIGSNEGIMLGCFIPNNIRVLGIDPSMRAGEIARLKGVDTITAYFDLDIAKQVSKEYGKADLILANNVIANIPDIISVVKGLESLLKEDGVFVFETSYLIDVVENNLIDAVHHEHLSYFCATALEQFFRANGLKMFHAERIKTKGGSLRGYVALSSSMHEDTQILNQLLIAEKKWLANIENNFIQMRHRLDSLKKHIADFLETKQPNDVIAYGASIGCVVMMYEFDLLQKVALIVDDNQGKHGRFVPGKALEVYPSSRIEDRNYVVLSLAWRYMGAIENKHYDFFDNGRKMYVCNLASCQVEVVER